VRAGDAFNLTQEVDDDGNIFQYTFEGSLHPSLPRLCVHKIVHVVLAETGESRRRLDLERKWFFPLADWFSVQTVITEALANTARGFLCQGYRLDQRGDVIPPTTQDARGVDASDPPEA
jgi:hypothetical protein